MEQAKRKAKGLPAKPKPDLTRQWGPIERIRLDHVNRYVFAAEYLGKKLKRGAKVLDIACGCGYGSWILHGAGFEVTGVDISSEAISYAERNYQGPTYLCQKAEDTKGKWDAVVTFETLEHLANPQAVLALEAPFLIGSVPNENQYPFSEERFDGDEYPHLRHYTPMQFQELLEDKGWTVAEKFCQVDKLSKVEKGTDGMFLIYIAKQ